MQVRVRDAKAGPVPLQTPSDLKPNAVRDLSGALNILLADMFTLYLKTKNFHWHMSGPHFRDYHLLLDEQVPNLGRRVFCDCDHTATSWRAVVEFVGSLMSDHGNKFVLERGDFQQLFNSLINRGYRVLGPTLREGAIVYDSITSTADLPAGWTDEQGGGRYRLHRRNDEAVFGYAVGPHSWKRFLHPPIVRLWQAKREGGRLEIQAEPQEITKVAFLGVRSCELHAIAIQDRVFIGGQQVETGYESRRKQVFIVAVNCGQAGGTCFCASMNTGPRTTSGFDLALTEIMEDNRHYFLVEAGTDAGADVLRELPHRVADSFEEQAAERLCTKTAETMGRKMETADLKEILYRNYEHPRWDNVAARCLIVDLLRCTLNGSPCLLWNIIAAGACLRPGRPSGPPRTRCAPSRAFRAPPSSASKAVAR